MKKGRKLSLFVQMANAVRAIGTNRNFSALGLSLTASLILSACGAPIHFSSAPTVIETPIGGVAQNGKVSFPLTSFSDILKQDDFGDNTLTLQFQAYDPATGRQIGGLKEKDLLIKENDLKVDKFKVTEKDMKIGRRADIIFVIDVTSSMDPYIDSTKMKVQKFVEDLGKTNIQASLCLVTFTDDVLQTCNKFVEDDPLTVKNENTLAFLDSLTRIRTGGGGDIPENQLGALIEASKTPWHKESQHIAILITDANFHYAPEFLGDATSAPEYKHTLDALKNQSVQTFIAAPAWGGYNSDFVDRSGRYPALTSATGGKWFDLEKIIKGTMDMGDVFSAIVEQLKSVYTLTYVIDEIPALDPTLPESARTVRIELASASQAVFQTLGLSTKYPSGRPNYKDEFELSHEDYDETSVRVSVNGSPIVSDYVLEKKKLKLRRAPAPKSEIRVEYLLKNLRDNLRLQPIIVSGVRSPDQILIEANGKLLSSGDYRAREIDVRKYMIELEDHVFDNTDPFDIRGHSGLFLQLSIK